MLSANLFQKKLKTTVLEYLEKNIDKCFLYMLKRYFELHGTAFKRAGYNFWNIIILVHSAQHGP